MARAIFCAECKKWVDVIPDRGVRGTRKVHAAEHTADAKLFSSDELIGLDIEFERVYGQVF
jgi:hypothetical protein